ncbi:ABC transporter ATP-binding protein [Kitasatospora sp. NPDC059827]|uniref:ABC transporter ATP-binding protein n=1 Tax=Kitasatospora sp. NPDC059827 TaxID=3346964 RepID=UPI0036606E75
MLEFDHVSKHFGTKPALTDLTFTVQPGQLFGFCGANGAGKTTAMRIALGVLDADHGTVRWRGVPVDDESRRRIGYMPEERGLYAKMRPRDQLVYFARLGGVPTAVARRRADEWIERLGVTMTPTDTLERLSLGNQQRIQLIAALIHDPQVLILDEPFSGLDPVAVDAMAQALTEFAARGVPVVFSSHQLELVERLCDRVGILAQGRLVAEGTVEELRAADGQSRLRICVTGAPPGWEERLPGARPIGREGGTVTVSLAERASARQVLAAAQSMGELEHFSWHQPTLAEVFRKSVAP